ncbi:MAG: hypothetical protein H0U13_12475 [Gemmatimonadaceae bacterium]|nr:hypothetical protein [Gemmatimonadaceae bacterium]
MSLLVSTGKAGEATSLMDAFMRGRSDPAYFCSFFMGRTLHDGQADFMLNAEAKVNCLATSNRWGKTTLLCGRHLHRGMYKVGAEWRYMNEDGTMDLPIFTSLKYETVHTAGEWEQASFVWEDALKILGESKRLAAFVKEFPRSKPPHIKGINGWKWLFRTLGNNASGIDGKSIYYLSIDEAGWITGLDEMMRNVLRIRIADVRGIIDLVGTFKPGISRDFYKMCVRASAYTGVAIDFAHGSDDDSEGTPQSLDSSIEKYLRQFGIDLTEYKDAFERGLHGL